MKVIVFIAAAIIAITSDCAFSQGDSTRYINGLPVSEADTARNFPDRDVSPANILRAVPIDELPGEVLEALGEGTQYKGWQDSTIYYQRNTGLYLVPVKYEGGVRIFGLNEKGAPVTYDEVANE